jgi:hypothetical protein
MTEFRTKAGHVQQGGHDELWSLAAKLNPALLTVSIIVLCFPATLFEMRALSPPGIEEYLLQHPSSAAWVSIAFVVVIRLGIPICVIALLLNLVLFFFRRVPLWLKVITTILVLTSILGTLSARNAIHVLYP